jgi:phosphatidate cytidylyltransferase
MSNLLQRVIVAVIAIPIVLFIVLYKPIAFFGLVLILTGLAAQEYFGLVRAKGNIPLSNLGITMAVLFAATFGKFRLIALLSDLGISSFSPETDLLIVLLIVLVIVTMTVELFRGLQNPIQNTATTLFGSLYTGIGIGSIFGIYEYFAVKNIGKESFDILPPGIFIVVMLISIWSCDSFAYFAGRAFGKHKLFERVSPKKTWEGAIAGLLGSIMTWIIAPMIADQLIDIKTVHLVMFGIIAGGMGQIGDLAESLLKRDANVKDSSHLIPGHGGVLDRLDSLLFVAPIILLYLTLIKV